MKRFFVLAFLVMALSACTRTQQATAPEEPTGQLLFQLPATDNYVTWEAEGIPSEMKAIDKPVTVKIVDTESSLAKLNDCSVSYGPSSGRWSFQSFSTRYPPLAPNIVIWYYGGIYLPDPVPQAFIAGVADLNGDLDCWTNAPAVTVRVTLRTRGFDAANVNPVLNVYAFENNLNTMSLRFVFKPGDIDLQKRHADVNIDISNVTVTAP